MRGRRRASIKYKAIPSIVVAIFIVVGIISLASYTRFKRIMTNEINQSLERIALESSHTISILLEQFLSPLEEISHSREMTSMNWREQSKMMENQINPNYLNLAIVDSSGISHDIDGTRINLRDRDYIIQAFRGHVNFSDIIVNRKTHEPSIMAAVPIFNMKKVVGVLIARLSVDFLSGIQLAEGYGKNGKAYIISSQGSLISRGDTKDNKVIFNLYRQDGKTAPGYDSLEALVKRNLPKYRGHDVFSINNSDYLIGFAAIEHTSWKIYIGASKAVIMSSLQQLKFNMLLAMIFSIVCSFFAAFFVLIRLAKPLQELDRMFEQGAKGDLTIRSTLRSNDELGRAGQSFNRMMNKINTLTQFDPLTGLKNQSVLEGELSAFLQSVRSQGQFNGMGYFSLMMISIDNLSAINEIHGYVVGDELILKVREVLRQLADDYCELYRYMGNDFIIFRKTAPVPLENKTMALKIIHTFTRNDLIIQGIPISVKVNIGIFNAQEAYQYARDFDPLLAVSQARAFAKAQGSNSIEVYSEDLQSRLAVQNQLRSELSHALAQGQFYLVYQPLFDFESHHVAELEALIRWQHPTRGIVPPDQFIELAEQSSFIIDLDFWVLKQACSQIKTWQVAGYRPVVMSVNITSRTFESPHFLTRLRQVVSQNEVDPHLLQLEITERVVMEEVELCVTRLNELRSMGFGIAIDDFGIGYSSLSYIVRLPVDSLKIDQSFVRNLSSSDEAKAIVNTIISLGKTLGLTVIAEGIESGEEHEYLLEHQCDIGQGYYFSKPIAPAQIEAFLEGVRG